MVSVCFFVWVPCGTLPTQTNRRIQQGYLRDLVLRLIFALFKSSLGVNPNSPFGSILDSMAHLPVLSLYL